MAPFIAPPATSVPRPQYPVGTRPPAYRARVSALSDPSLSLLRVRSKANVSLDDAGLVLLRLRCTNDPRNGGQLQHACMLAFAQPREQHDLPARQFQSVVVCIWLVYVDLPKPRHRPHKRLLGEDTK